MDAILDAAHDLLHMLSFFLYLLLQSIIVLFARSHHPMVPASYHQRVKLFRQSPFFFRNSCELITRLLALRWRLQTRKERFMGWYHSHPFDVEVHSHCFLSSTDISTQLSWQRAEDPHGNPWLAIVVRCFSY